MAASLAVEALQSDLAFVERELAKHPDPYDTVRFMWQQRKEALEQELAEIEHRPDNFARVALLFRGAPVIGSEEIRLDFTARVLDNYQTVVATVAAARAGSELRARGRLPSSFSSKLFVRDMMRGSVGFLIEEQKPDQLSLVPSILKEAVAQTSEILESLTSGERSEFERQMNEVSPRTLSAVKKMAKVLFDAGAETEIVGDTKALVLSHQSTAALYLRLTDIELAERREVRSGILLGLFPERRQFEFKPDGGDLPVFYGPVSETLDARYLADPGYARSILLKRALATFMVTCTLRGGIPIRDEWMLEDLQFPADEGLPPSSLPPS
jgi:hypothetical protein